LAVWRAGVKGITLYRYGSKPSQARQMEVDAESIGNCLGYVCEL